MDKAKVSGTLDDSSILPRATTVFVYGLANKINNEIYVGITKDLEVRLFEHNSGRGRYTKAFKPWYIFHTEEFTSYEFARKREKYFKTASGKNFLRRIFSSTSGPEITN